MHLLNWEQDLKELQSQVFQKEKEIQSAENKRALEQQNLVNYNDWSTQYDQERSNLDHKIKIVQEQSTDIVKTIEKLEFLNNFTSKK